MTRALIPLVAAGLLCTACAKAATPVDPASPTTSVPTDVTTPTLSPTTGSATGTASASSDASTPAAAGTGGGGGSGAVSTARTVEDPGGVLPYVRLTMPLDVMWTTRTLPPPGSSDVRHGAWVYRADGSTTPSCALRVTVQGGFHGNLTALKLQYEKSSPGDGAKVIESSLTNHQNGFAQELVQASTGTEESADGKRHPFTTWARSVVTDGGTFLQVVGVAHDDSAEVCQAERIVRTFAPTGTDLTS